MNRTSTMHIWAMRLLIAPLRWLISGDDVYKHRSAAWARGLLSNRVSAMVVPPWAAARCRHSITSRVVPELDTKMPTSFGPIVAA